MREIPVTLTARHNCALCSSPHSYGDKWTRCRAKHRCHGQAPFVGQNGIAVASGGEPAVAAANKKAGHLYKVARLFSAALFLGGWLSRPFGRLRFPHIHFVITSFLVKAPKW